MNPAGSVFYGFHNLLDDLINLVMRRTNNVSTRLRAGIKAAMTVFIIEYLFQSFSSKKKPNI